MPIGCSCWRRRGGCTLMDCAAAVEGLGVEVRRPVVGLGVVGTREGRQRGCGVWATGNLPLGGAGFGFQHCLYGREPARAGNASLSCRGSERVVERGTELAFFRCLCGANGDPWAAGLFEHSKLPVRRTSSSSWPTIFSKLPVRQRTCSCSCSCSCSFSKLPVRQRTRSSSCWISFLSCLCGSEQEAPALPARAHAFSACGGEPMDSVPKCWRSF